MDHNFFNRLIFGLYEINLQHALALRIMSDYNQKARVSEVRLVLLKGFETCCNHALGIKGLVLTTKVKISSGPLVFDLIAWLVLDAAR